MVRDDVASLPAAFQRCRDKLHDWDPLDAVREGMVLRVTERCRSCRSEKTSLLSLRQRDRGVILRSWMSRYAEGYLLPKGAGRLDVFDRGELRLRRLGF